MDAKIGSSEWWTQTADKVIGMGLDVIQTKLQGVDNTGGSNAPYVGAATGTSKWLPYAFGAAAVAGIVLIMRKR
jgi:hypothetical protein